MCFNLLPDSKTERDSMIDDDGQITEIRSKFTHYNKIAEVIVLAGKTWANLTVRWGTISYYTVNKVKDVAVSVFN